MEKSVILKVNRIVYVDALEDELDIRVVWEIENVKPL